MHRAQEQVRDFNRAFGKEGPSKPRCAWPHLQGPVRTLIEEEFAELMEALDGGDAWEVIKEVCDLIYVLYNVPDQMGIDLEPFWEEVHRTNMRKAPGQLTREDGKGLKPPGWIPPDLKAIYVSTYNESRFK